MKSYPLHKTHEVHAVRDLFRYPMEHTPDKDVFRVRTGKDSTAGISWKRFKSDVDSLGTALYARGMKGRHIAVIGENMYEWVLTYMTAMCGDMVIVPLDKDLPAEQLQELISFADVSAIVFSPKYADVIQKIRPDLPNVDLFVSMRRLSGFVTIDDLIEEGAKLLADGDTSYVDEEPDVHKTSALVFTSGTTGRPKGVMLSQDNIVSSFDGARRHLEYTEEDVMLSILPLHHAYESVCGILAMLHSNATICFNENLKLLMSNMQLFSPTGLSAVPLVLDTLYRGIRDGAKKSGRLRQLETGLKVSGLLGRMREKVFSDVREGLGGRLKKGFVGGAPMNPETLSALNAMGIEFRQGYGITECSPLVSVNREKANKNGSVGLVLPDLEVRIQDDEIQVRGRGVMLGYYKDPDATRDAFTEDGWFRTGDLGYVDEDGFLFITGRRKNLIILESGENISPEELELLLDRSPLVRECVVMEENGQIAAHIYPDPEFLSENGQTATLQALSRVVSKVNAKQPRYRHITKTVLHEKEFEKSTTKKILRDRVRS